jgi:hypothetical protein
MAQGLPASLIERISPMKKLIALVFCASILAYAGPLKIATYPLVHPKKTAKAVKAGTKATVLSTVAAGKAVLW